MSMLVSWVSSKVKTLGVDVRYGAVVLDTENENEAVGFVVGLLQKHYPGHQISTKATHYTGPLPLDAEVL